MNPYTITVLIALMTGLALQFWLLSRHARHVYLHRTAVPEAFREHVSLDAHQKAADYTVAKIRLQRIEEIWAALLFLFWTMGGGLNTVDHFWDTIFPSSSLWRGTAFVVSVFLLMSIIDLPFAIYRTFVLEERFGFNRITARIFISDTIKQTLLFALFAIPLTWVVLWLMDSSGSAWWIYAWSIWMGFGLFITWAYPFIAHLFNKFTPLSNEELRKRVIALVERCGFHTDGVYVMDGSRRSSHGNAYFTGLGNNKRIVFFDTLLDSLSATEVEAVLAHELGHFRHHHVFKRWILIGAMSFSGLAILGYLIHQTQFYLGMGINNHSSHTALVLFLLVTPIFSIFVQPILAYFLRSHEFAADDFSCRTMGEPSALRSALLHLYRENAGTLTPDPLYSAFYDSHPSAPIRIARISLHSSSD